MISGAAADLLQQERVAAERCDVSKVIRPVSSVLAFMFALQEDLQQFLIVFGREVYSNYYGLIMRPAAPVGQARTTCPKPVNCSLRLQLNLYERMDVYHHVFSVLMRMAVCRQ